MMNISLLLLKDLYPLDRALFGLRCTRGRLPSSFLLSFGIFVIIPWWGKRESATWLHFAVRIHFSTPSLSSTGDRKRPSFGGFHMQDAQPPEFLHLCHACAYRESGRGSLIWYLFSGASWELSERKSLLRSKETPRTLYKYRSATMAAYSMRDLSLLTGILCDIGNRTTKASWVSSGHSIVQNVCVGNPSYVVNSRVCERVSWSKKRLGWKRYFLCITTW